MWRPMTRSSSPLDPFFKASHLIQSDQTVKEKKRWHSHLKLMGFSTLICAKWVGKSDQNRGLGRMNSQLWRWVVGCIYIVAVATIWIAASFVVQTVVDSGVSPFLITYICNSLFMIYIPVAEISRYLENSVWTLRFWPRGKNSGKRAQALDISEAVVLLGENNSMRSENGSAPPVSMGQRLEFELDGNNNELLVEDGTLAMVSEHVQGQLNVKGHWTRAQTAKVSLLICPFWFIAQLTFNLSLKYTTVTSNTILSSSSSLFTFLAALMFLGEKFVWVKLMGVLLCMGGTIIVSLGDSKSVSSAIASNPLLGDILALVSTSFYAAYVTLVRQKLPDENDEKVRKASMAEFLGYLGLFNVLIFLPAALVLNFAELEPFKILSWKQFGLIVGKGLLDNVLSDYLWAKAVLLTSMTVATAGLTMQVPLAAIVDTLTGKPPHFMDYLGAASVMVGFVGINIPADFCSSSRANNNLDKEVEKAVIAGEDQNLGASKEIAIC